ncbi:hypothetical protein OU994_00540 [Pseudoduganella sp. SL102]|uniref:DUF6708 domain-containing protein n=1 Tax=Pseudoduganella sp. SL102 TaxID=2995154 RepID=UPI00248C6085|nr:DUF6708 domain-containing protein [Pseudoduganella sp. SL102]WBS02826.1 hypothetical protein OU994_00540 [Pseudoduganella sp. SL102]
MNSTYLESVDKWFGWKGFLTLIALSLFCILVIGISIGALQLILTGLSATGSAEEDSSFYIWNGIAMLAVLVVPVAIGLIWLLRKDSFAFTHYPIRFNRKTRTVHVLRTDGTVLSVPWDEVFFTLGHMPQWDDWEVRGHVLKSDRKTVQETFALSYVGSMELNDRDPKVADSSANDFVRAHWEFVRRYMEEGPQSVSEQVQFCMPVQNHRESFRGGLERAFANISGAPSLIYIAMFPFLVLLGLARFIAMRTSKIPEWPADVEASCVIEPNDPYAIHGAPNGDRMPLFPEAAKCAGVGFKAF